VVYSSHMCVNDSFPFFLPFPIRGPKPPTTEMLYARDHVNCIYASSVVSPLHRLLLDIFLTPSRVICSQSAISIVSTYIVVGLKRLVLFYLISPFRALYMRYVYCSRVGRTHRLYSYIYIYILLLHQIRLGEIVFTFLRISTLKVKRFSNLWAILIRYFASDQNITLYTYAQSIFHFNHSWL